MLCAIYKSRKKAGMYLYVAKREQFEAVPRELLDVFGKPEFVLLFNLAGDKPLALADKNQVQQHLEQQGFYLQMPKTEENLYQAWQLANKSLSNK